MATINGDAGNNGLSGGADADEINGLGGNDTLSGAGGNDTIRGGDGNDELAGGTGNDTLLGGTGNDLFYWAVGGGGDQIEGQDGLDRAIFTGSVLAEAIQVTANAGLAHVWRVGDSTDVDLNDVERIYVHALGGADSITVSDLAGTGVSRVAIDLAGVAGVDAGDGAADEIQCGGNNGDETVTVALTSGQVSVTGFAAQLFVSNAEATDTLAVITWGGNDSINASKVGADVIGLELNGAAGNDTIIGSKGNDTLDGSLGNDVIEWYRGDGLDEVEGGSDTDRFRMYGGSVSEVISISADLGMASVLRNGSGAETNNVERLGIYALGGADTITVSDLTDSEVTNVVVDLAASVGGTSADADVDTVSIFGTDDDDVAELRWSNGTVAATGLAAAVSVTHAGSKDIIQLNGGTGNDVISANVMPTGKVRVVLNGGADDDFLIGSAGNDTVIGGTGNDKAFLGAGNDWYVWNKGDGDDRVEGQTGLDVALIKGTTANDSIGVSAIGGGFARVESGGGNLDLNEVEQIHLRPDDGFDTIAVYNLAGTDVTLVAIDLSSGNGTGDGKPESVDVNGTAGNDTITIATAGGVLSVTGLPASVTISHSDTSDDLVVLADDGNDVIKVSSSGMSLLLIGDEGNDTITGGAGNDQLRGGDDDDRLKGYGGNDRLDGGLGNDVVSGGSGDDTITAGVGDDRVAGGDGSDTFALRFGTLGDLTEILDFDGDAAGGQDTINLDQLLDTLNIATADRASRISINDLGGTVDLFVDADGSLLNGYEYKFATVQTTHDITVGQDIVVGTL